MGQADRSTGDPAQGVVLTQTNNARFVIPVGSTQLRILTNANIPINLSHDPETVWRYGVKVTLLAVDGSIILDHSYHFATNLSLFQDPDSTLLQPISRYWDTPLQPLNSRAILIKLDTLRAYPNKVIVKRIDGDPTITDVVARMHCKRVQSLHKINVMWQRMRSETKERLMQSNVYPVPLTTESEIRNALAWYWEQLPPEGMAGRDFNKRVIYTHRTRGPREINHDIAPEGIPVSPYLHATLPLPEEGATISVAFTLLNAEAATVTWFWYGKGIGKRSSGIVKLTKNMGHFDLNLGGGLLELKSTEAAVLKVNRIMADGSKIDVTPKPNQSRSYMSTAKTPIEFAVRHPASAPLEFLLRIRTVLPENGDNRPSSNPAVIQLITDNGTVQKEIPIQVPPERSYYDQALHADGDLYLSEPISRYFLLPPTVTAIRIAGLKHPIMVNAFNRPFQLIRHTRVPEDYYQDSPDKASSQPNWFPLRSLNHKNHENDGRFLLLRTRSKPPRPINPAIIEGNYSWESYRPVGPWNARYLLLPKARLEPQKTGLSAAEFYPITNGRQTVEFVAPGTRNNLSPTLIFLSKTSEPRHISVSLDERPLASIERYSSRGELPLPLISAGRHTLTVKTTPPAICYINHINKPDTLPFLRRFAFTFNQGTTSFSYEKKKRERELVMLRIYSTDENPTPGRVRVRLQIDGTGIHDRSMAIGDFPAWTFIIRTFDIRIRGGERFPVLGTQSETVDMGQPVFVPLNEDLPPGRYTVHISIDESPGNAYIVLSHTRPGTAEKRKISMEDDSL
ncbi:hypothetical protein BVX99_02150 [bacterium F16]|nr:hypothetical protein BVX99_02150 [bacterium F16]